MRLLPLTILVATLGLSACVLDTGIDPSVRIYPGSDAAISDDATGDDDQDTVSADGTEPTEGDGVITGADTVADADGIGPLESTPVPLRQGAWPATFTTTLQGGGWTLQPLGAQRGFTGTVSAPDGSLHLEALP
jgi:hypothetical protein